jgi:hypothetical protein
MKKILLYLMLLLSMFAANGCRYERRRDVYIYPEGYREWPESRRSEWRHEHPGRYEERHEEHHGERH